MSEFAAVVLAGGAARRMGGAAKPALPVGGRPMLIRVLDAAADARPRIVVGPLELAPLLPAAVSLTVEERPGTGPVAGLAAGLHLLAGHFDQVAVLASDLPFLTIDVLTQLRARIVDGVDAAVLVDDQGRPQWLCAVWRHRSLDRQLAALGDPAGRPMRDLVAGANVRELTVAAPAGGPPWFDCDTDDDVRRAEEWIHGQPR